jgi:hypothetical protein
MNIIEMVLNQPELKENPPVLLDIGASANLHEKWREIAKHSICIAFDADERDMEHTTQASKEYYRLYVFNAIVTENLEGEANFYLTRSPYCSSLLEPDIGKLQLWAFAPLFETENRVRLKCTTLPTILREVGVSRVDWFKTDSQGTDLRLFKSLGQSIINHVLIAEFEPGIMDSYKGEDKLHALMSYMESHPFWLSEMECMGTQRISQRIIKHYFPGKSENMGMYLRNSPFWVNITYLNSFDNNTFSKRDFLLGWVFATMERQYGFALELAHYGERKFNDSLFLKLAHNSMSCMCVNYRQARLDRDSKYILQKIKRVVDLIHKEGIYSTFKKMLCRINKKG